MRRLNLYSCNGKNCKLPTLLSEDIDEGVTPFSLPCACGGILYSHFYPALEKLSKETQEKPVDIEWYRPTEAEIVAASRAMAEHYTSGGLALRVKTERAAHLRKLLEA